MAPLDSLPADQRAVLQLVLQRGRTYDDIAKLLSIDRSAVRQRALAALDALGPETDLPSDERADITDYLLGQLSPGAADQTRDRLADSAPERAWARVIASELSDISKEPLPEIPAAGGRSEAAEPTTAETTEPETTEPEAMEGTGEIPAGAAAAGAAAAAGSTPPAEPGQSAASRVTRALRGDRAEPAAGDGGGPGEGQPGSSDRAISRRGGAILLAVAAIVVIVVVVILATSGGSSKHNSTAASSTPTTTSPAGTSTAGLSTTGSSTTGASTTGTGTSSTTPTQVIGQINLNSPTAGSKTTGVAEVLKQGATNGIAIVGQNVPANTKSDAYAVWLYNSPTDAHLLGFVNPGVTSNGRLSTAGALPSNASHYKQLIVTRETQASPKSPGTIILQGTLTGV